MSDENRKLTAIMSADVVGYSKLMAADEAATVKTLQDYRMAIARVIERHKGRVINAPGDNILADFPSAVEAVESASEIQQVLKGRNLELPVERRMHFRIGINLGDVIEAADGTIYGDGVNIAARMEALADTGGICISNTVFDAVEGKLDFGFEFLGAQQVKNIERPITVCRVRTESAAAANQQPAKGAVRRITVPILASALVLAIVAGIAGWWFMVGDEAPQMVAADGTPTDDPVLAMPTGPSIAVLPFDDLGGDDGSRHFADGLVEDIITALSRFPDLMVFARNTTFQYKNAGVSAQEIHQELGADYVLQGSVRRGNDRLRVTAQLVDAETVKQIWAESFDRELTGVEVFDIQDEITRTIVATLADTYGQISRATFEKSQRKAAGSLESYECVAAAHAYYRTAISPDVHLKVRDCLEGAVAKDPDNAEAWAWLAGMYRDETSFGFNARPEPIERAMEAARRSVAIDPENQQGHLVLAHMHYLRHDLDAFFVEAERTLKINPNSADALSAMGGWMALAGKWERGVALMRKATVLDPKYPSWYNLVFGHERFNKGEYEAALNEYLKVDLPDFFWAHAVLASTYGHLGRDKDAARAVDRLLEVYPNFGEHVRGEFAKWNVPEEFEDRTLEGLRKAGLEIPALTN